MRKSFIDKSQQKVKIIRSIFSILLAIVFAVSLILSINVISKMVQRDRYERYMQELEEIKRNNELQALAEINNDFVAWITIDDVKISLPVVKTSSISEEKYYLDHDFNKKSNYLGCPYQKHSGMIGETDNTVLVAHSSFETGINGQIKHEIVFGKLKEYLTQNNSFNYTITLETFNGIYTYQICSAFKFSVSKNHNSASQIYSTYNFENESTYNKFVSNYTNLSNINRNVETSYGDKFLTLYTCYSNDLDYRVLIVAKQIS